MAENLYDAKRKELLTGFEEYTKKPKKKDIVIPQYIKILGKNGRAYSGFILDYLHSNKITLSAAAEYLGTNTQHISAVEAHI